MELGGIHCLSQGHYSKRHKLFSKDTNCHRGLNKGFQMKDGFLTYYASLVLNFVEQCFSQLLDITGWKNFGVGFHMGICLENYQSDDTQHASKRQGC